MPILDISSVSAPTPLTSSASGQTIASNLVQEPVLFSNLASEPVTKSSTGAPLQRRPHQVWRVRRIRRRPHTFGVKKLGSCHMEYITSRERIRTLLHPVDGKSLGVMVVSSHC